MFCPKVHKVHILIFPSFVKIFHCNQASLSMMIYHCHLKSSSSSVGLFSHSGAFLVISPFFFLSLILSVAQSYRSSNTPSQFFEAFRPSVGKLGMSAAPTVLSPHTSSAFTSRRRFSTATSHSTFSLSNTAVISQTCLNAAVSSSPSDNRFFDVSVSNNVKEAEGLRLVTIEVPTEVAERYSKPGQYVKLRVKDGSSSSKPAYFAIASPPTNPSSSADPLAKISTTFTFLIKEVPQHDFVLSGTSPLEISLPLGVGFNIPFAFNGYKTDFPVMNTLLFATGSGIAPIASVIDSKELSISNELTNLITVSHGIKFYYGVKTPNHIPFQSKFDDWKKKGIEVIPVISQPNDPFSLNWKGKKGYIQDTFREDGVHIPRNTAALLCGQR